MSIPKNITKSHVEKAINEIEESTIPNERLSYNFFLVEKGKKLPPTYVICIANKYANNHELKGNEFNEAQARFFLKKLGFNIIQKNQDSANVWFVCQGSTFTDEFGKKYLWAPKFDKKGNPKFHWENMKKVKKDDIIFNYSKGVRGISIALNDSYDSENPESQSTWGKEGYRVDIKFFEFDEVVKIEELKRKKEDIELALRKIDKKPFNVNGEVNQGYLFEFTSEAGKIIYKTYGKPVGNEIIDSYFNSVQLSKDIEKGKRKEFDFKFLGFSESVSNSGLFFSSKLITRFISSLLTKPFVILSGLSGSGKTKLAQAFVQWICGDEDQYKIVPVGADWTNREPLLGYPNALDSKEYIQPDNGIVDLILHAHENSDLPHFLILDEMNLSHVERYFADFLSVMESNGKINFHSGAENKSGIPASVSMPDNLFIIGTINVDETTYMFSPKVLDRANVIEFRITENELEEFLENPVKPDLEQLKGAGAAMAESFLQMVGTKRFEFSANGELNRTLLKFFGKLKKTGAEFGYRSAYEIHRLVNQLTAIDPELKDEEKLDIAIMQKLLPKLHGSRRKLCPILVTLGNFCIDSGKFENIEENIFSSEDFNFERDGINYPLSLEKIARMYKGAIDNGFASYAEA